MKTTWFLFISLMTCFLVKADVNPCEDFYTFACEEFIRDAHIPKNRNLVDQLSILEADVTNKLRTLLLEDNPDDSRIQKLPKTFYNACVHNGDSDIEEIQDLLEDFHGFPVNSEWDESSFNWLETLYKLNDLGMAVGFPFNMGMGSTGTDENNEEKTEVRIVGSYMKWYISNDTEGNAQTAAYYKYMVDAAELLGADRQTAETDMMDVLMFENEMEKIKFNPDIKGGPQVLIVTLGELSIMEPRFPWLEYVNRIVPGTENINETQAMDLYPDQYILSMMDVIQQTDNRTLANYLNWNFVNFAFDYLNGDLKKLKPDFLIRNEYDYSYSFRQRSEKGLCLMKSYVKFQDILSILFLRKYFPSTDQHAVANMMEEIKEEVKQMLIETEWMDEETNEAAQRKLAHMNIQVGYPEAALEESRIENKYEQLTLVPGSFLQITLNVTKFLQDVHLSRLYLPKIWLYEHRPILYKTVGTTVWLQRFVNGMVIPAGLLQPPIYNRSSSDEVNYGSAGYAIARRFITAFNEEGFYRNALGEFKDLYTETSKEAYKNKSQCAIDAYQNLLEEYQIEEYYRGEDYVRLGLADSAGAKLAYRAYQKTISQNKVEESTEESYSKNQLFWLSMANLHCMKHRIPNEHHRRWSSLVFRLGKEQVTPILMNNEDFSRDWNCELGSPMNPEEKCQVW